jgi:hypothetical protein
METLVPLAILAGTSGAFLFASKKKKQGFKNIVGSSTQDALESNNIDFINQTASRFNPISNLLNPLKNVLLNEDSNINTVEKTLKDSLRTVDINFKGGYLKAESNPTDHIKLNGGSRVLNLVKKCEKINTINCDAFNDKDFAENCGMCHENGVNSKGSNIIGGLFVTDDDKFSMEQVAKNLKLRKPNYQPSVGKCDNDRFTTTKAHCIRLKNQLECQKKQSYEVEGCSQCAQDEHYTYVDPSVLKTNAKIMIAGHGTVNIRRSQKDQYGILSYKLSLLPQEVPLTDFQEGDEIILTLEEQSSYISGYLEGTTITGKFTVDIVRLITVDSVTGQKPRVTGVMQMGDQYYSEIRPGRGKKNMNLVLTNTFTFIDSSEEEAIPCPSSPYIGTEASAKILASGDCYKSGQVPGKYSLQCLQGVFTSAGCEVRGDGYPSSSGRAEKLMRDNNGNLLTHGQIASAVYNTSQIAYSGMNESGKKLTIPEWDEVSRWCTGRRILSPCTIEGDGPHSAECLAYLWLNKGATDGIENGEGPTYTTNMKNASLNNTVNQYCTTKGYMSPVNPDGTFNQKIVKNWNELGRTDLQWVKWNMDHFHKMANDNTLSDEERKPWVAYCYGIDFSNNVQKQEAEIFAKPDMKTKKYIPYPNTNLNKLICPPGSPNGRCWKNTLGEAINFCNKLPDCIGITQDHIGFEPRAGTHERWHGINSWLVKDVPEYTNTLDTKHGRTRSEFSTKKNYVVPTNYTLNTQIAIIGPFGSGPWNRDYGSQWGEYSNIRNFKDDGKAMWIWPNNLVTRPVYGVKIWYPLVKTYINDTDNNIVASVNLCVDYYVRFFFNGSPAGRADQMAAHERFNITIPPGENLFQFDVCGDIADSVHRKNGFICIVRDNSSNEVLFRTDGSWRGGTFK